MPEPGQTSGPRFKVPTAAIVVVVAFAVGVLAWLLLNGDDDDANDSRPRPVAASVEELRQAGSSVDVPVFWAGDKEGFKYELTKSNDGSVFVRYLPEDVDIGDPRPDFLTVATYALPNGYARLLAQSKRPGARTRKLDSDGLALVNRDRPSSVYVAYPRGKYQVEVYDPAAGRALDLAVSEEIRPVR